MNIYAKMTGISNLKFEELITLLKENNISEFYFIEENGTTISSHPQLEPLKNEIVKLKDFLGHEAILLEYDATTNSLFAAFVYNTVRGQAAGGARLNNYENIKSFIMDGLRLSKGMADKNAIARLWWGGGKGIIYNPGFRTLDAATRKIMFQNYGNFISKLNGVYITAEDMNTKPSDIADIFSRTRFTTCIPVNYGGSSNPSIYTAKGVFSGIKAAASYKYGTNNPLKDKIVLLHGAGNVGYHILELLIDHHAKVFVYDINLNTISKLKEEFNPDQVEVIEDENKFFAKEAHILSPNAIGAILNDEVINNLKVDIVCGGANNQLLDPEKHSEMLKDKGIIYLPDFYVNRLGIINCANEQYGYVKSAIDKEVELVFLDSLNLLKEASDKNKSPFAIANQIATERQKIKHPIFGHRGPELIKEAIISGFGK